MAVSFDTAQEGGKKKTLRESAQEAKANADAAQAKKPAGFKDSRSAQLEAALNRLLERPGFSYDPEADPLFRAARDNITAQGRQAMEDTMGTAAALTGGYGSSYSQQAGQQAYSSYLGKLNDMLPGLYDRAAELYDREGKQLLDGFGLVQSLSDRDYDRYADGFDRWLKEYGLAQDRYLKLMDLWERSLGDGSESTLEQILRLLGGGA